MARIHDPNDCGSAIPAHLIVRSEPRSRLHGDSGQSDADHLEAPRQCCERELVHRLARVAEVFVLVAELVAARDEDAGRRRQGLGQLVLDSLGKLRVACLLL